ncbi:MAG: hypothetical protein QXL15_02370, partial [Candidatus Korarchaeota archaeon]
MKKYFGVLVVLLLAIAMLSLDERISSAPHRYSDFGAPVTIRQFATNFNGSIPYTLSSASPRDTYMQIPTGWQAYNYTIDVFNLADINQWLNNNTFPSGTGDGNINTNDTIIGWNIGAIDSRPPEWQSPTYPNWNRLVANWYSSGGIGDSSCAELIIFGNNSNSQYPSYYFYNNDSVWLSQAIFIPRGRIINAAVQFSFNLYHVIQSGGATFNEFEIYVAINNTVIVTLPFQDARTIAGGFNTWGTISKPIVNWVNVTPVFSSNNTDQTIVFSIGIRHCPVMGWYGGFTYSNYQQVRFDNVYLTLTTLVNATQVGLSITPSGGPTYNLQNVEYGRARVSFTGLWNPPYLRSTLSVTTSSQVTLLYNGILYVNRTVTSAVDIDGVAGTRISVNNGSSVYWTFYVKIEIPSILSHHTFNASLPADWVPVSVVDSYPMDVTANIFYANGILTVPESVASTKGWWFFNFSAQNYVTTHNIEVFRNGEWISSSEVYANEMIRINTSLLGNPTTGNITLSIYAPNGGLWYNISTTPSGNIISFGPITMDPSNSSGGAYISRIYWSNSTEAGLFEREFVVVHKTSISMELPYDAQLTNKSAAAYNSTVAIAIRYTDIDSNVPVSGATVYYNVIGTGIYDTMKEVSPGIYKDPDGLDTSYLPSAGTYTVNITATCRGFITRNINLILEVTYPTIMDIAEAPIISGLWNSTVYLHINYTLINGTGVTGATVKL